MAPNSLVLEEKSEEGVTVLHRITKLLQMNDSITRLRVEVESEEPLSIDDIPEVSEPEADEPEEPEEEEEEEPEPEKEPKFREKDSFSYRIAKALVDADRGLYLNELKDALGGPDEAPPNLSGNLYSLVDRGYVHKQKHEHPNRDRKLYRYYATSKGEQTVENTE